MISIITITCNLKAIIEVIYTIGTLGNKFEPFFVTDTRTADSYQFDDAYFRSVIRIPVSRTDLV